MSIESENGGVKKPIMPVKIGKPATVNVKDSNIENESSNEEKDKNEDNSSVTGNDTSESNESSNETNEDNNTNEVEIDGEKRCYPEYESAKKLALKHQCSLQEIYHLVK